MQPSGRRRISGQKPEREPEKKAQNGEFFLAFYVGFCYTNIVTAARGWEYAHFWEYRFSRILC